MLNIGCHLSISKGFSKAANQAILIGGNTFQFFTRNPRGGKAKALDQKDVDELKLIMDKNKFAPLFAHGSYTMNLCSNKEDIREFAKGILKDDLVRLSRLPRAYYIFHPGSHVKQGSEQGIAYITEALNDAVGPDNKVDILLEGMSGKGTEIGRNFEEIAAIINGVEHNEKLGICIDTCHLYSAGYDIVNDLDGVLAKIDETIGLNRLKAIHLNDSKTDFGSNKDRHEVIGEGTIGEEAIIRIINHPKLRNLTFNLETPNELEGYKAEIEYLKSKYIEV